MAAVTEDNITDEVCARYSNAPSPRMVTLMTSLVRHLHDYAREVQLTREEWLAALDFLIRAGKMSDEKRNEIMLASDVLGLSMLTVMIDQKVPAGATPNTVEGPFFIEGSPELPAGGDMRFGAPGKLCFMTGRVTDMTGRPIAGALIDAWQADQNGLYECQVGANDAYLRGKFHTDADGRYCVTTVVPCHYSIPIDGPVGELVAATGISHERPAHIHATVRADGYQTLITHIFRGGAEYIDCDAVYGVRPELVIDFHDHEPGQTPAGTISSEPFSTVNFDVVLAPAVERKLAAE
jgi:hydroxyquinol 1,2-dioxygenase